MTEKVDAVVIGAGVVGLAVARELALAGREVIVLEAEESIGNHTSSRNSEVIHAGIYYPKGSLKANLCVSGKDKLYAYCRERGIPHRGQAGLRHDTTDCALGGRRPTLVLLRCQRGCQTRVRLCRRETAPVRARPWNRFHPEES